MKKLALLLGAPMVLGLTLAVMAATAPPPVAAVSLPTIVDLPVAEAMSCKALAAPQASTATQLATAVALFGDGATNPCVAALESALRVCYTFGKDSEQCKTARKLAEDICRKQGVVCLIEGCTENGERRRGA